MLFVGHPINGCLCVGSTHFLLLYGRKIQREFNLADGLQFHLVDFNLAVLFSRAMMSYVIVMLRIRNPNAPSSSNVRSRCRSANMEAELYIES